MRQKGAGQKAAELMPREAASFFVPERHLVEFIDGLSIL